MKAFITASCHHLVFGSSDIAGRIDPRVSFCHLVLTEKYCILSLSHTRYFPSRVLMPLSLSGHRQLLRSVIRTAVGCDCASYS